MGVPKTGEGIIDLIGQVQRVYEQQEEEGPITVHCSDGVGRTGVFCALAIVLERMRSEGVVDLFQTVKLLRTQRPGMVQTQVSSCFPSSYILWNCLFKYSFNKGTSKSRYYEFSGRV